jgi:hypothetical protein
MLDCRGNLLREGDIVAVGINSGNLLTGELVHDPDDIRWKRLTVKTSGGRLKRVDKQSSRIVNLTAFHEKKLDNFITI